MNKISLMERAISLAFSPELARVPVKDPILKYESKEAATWYVFNGLDEEIIPTVPPGILNQFDPSAVIWTNLVWPAHFKVWVRLNQIEESLGRWLYWEAKMPLFCLRFPKSKSFLCFERLTMIAFSMGCTLFPDRADEIKGIAKALLDPNTIWR